ncbi:hypothetical protein K504DRAFT_505695 [Pleomassaria siparia CBS 279.74]|uniref:SH3 domain-containing protein n=1 Tax=Pleomassaria siparia CBS 279.74 TaxID=1314801 RepID=A0A6G1K0C9_9PLEO|nr:hypothetical protein K504DRAFT_505695 [Pleomassaria siparia CBS 279.74]
MTRPQIIRADTLDLQDKTSPTAQDHSRQPEHPSPLGIGPAAPHQEASMRLVNDERISEESHLQNGNRNDANTLREEPETDDERTLANGGNGDENQQQDETAVRLNGGMTGDGDEEDMQDADEEDMDDDDMMDKISSSPSIDDGGYSSTSSPSWPKRGSSLALTPTSSPIQSPNTDAYADSSPFTITPIHFPISAAAARRHAGVPAGNSETISKSLYRSSPIPFSFRSSSKKEQQRSAEHHRGEYIRPRTTENASDPARLEDNSNISPRTERLSIVENRLQNARQDSQTSLISDFDEDEARLMFQPVRSPLRDDPLDDTIRESQMPENNPALVGETLEDQESWTTESDADSWDEEANDDDSKDISFSDDPRFIDSGWGGECLREIEDIDFEFVYALHTFVATVEGQANATKGDTMVLLDDSNSYWWLVRVVKDSSIGYLPAEHIETPTERLARLNKHRNIDLSATMLGDTGEKTKNPLKKAMRRRNAKTVQFAPPTYVEASDYDYSSDEGGDDELFGGADPNQAQAQTAAATDKADGEQDRDLKVKPLQINGAKQEANGTDGEVSQVSSDESAKTSGDASKEGEEGVDRPMDPKVSRNGTLRNTDSFFKDENTETRKITLTPNILRDDSSTSTTGSKERAPSLESLEKNGFADKIKDDKKKKEKKSGMLSGLFKRKDKKSKEAGSFDSTDSDAGKQSEEFGRSSPQSKRSEDFSTERPSTEQASAQSSQMQSSKGKLQKSQRTRDDSPSKGNANTSKPTSPEPTTQTAASQEAPTSKPAGSQTASTMRLVAPEQEEVAKSSSAEPVQSSEGRSRSGSAAGKLNPLTMLKSQPNGESRPEKVKKAKQRVQLDDFDSEDDEKNDPFADPDEARTKLAQPNNSEPVGRLSESPVHVSAADAQPQEKEAETDQPPGLTGDTSSQETSSPISTPTPDDSPSTSTLNKPNPSAARGAASPSPTHAAPSSVPPPLRPAPTPAKEMEPSPPASSDSAQLPAWSDSSLRTYLDDGTDLRDMLLIIHDTTGVVPVGADHPLMSQLFVEETKAVSGLSGELDALLNSWLEKKRKTRNSPVSPAKAMR